MIKYLGSKRQLIPWILDTISTHFPDAASVLDLFSGTSRVGSALKSKNFQVFANDHNLFAYHLADCYIATSAEDLPKDIFEIISYLNNLPGQAGFFTEHYCVKARFFHPKNGERIDAIRNAIDKLELSSKLRSVLLVSLMEAADRIDSTCGIQMAFLKDWAPRAHLDMSLRLPVLSAKSTRGESQAFCLDAHEAGAQINSDVVYLDPPYNQHSYRGNYHIWETLVRNDSPEVYGRAQKRLDCKTVKSEFNSKPRFQESLEILLNGLKCRRWVISFSDEGFISRTNLENLLSKYGSVSVQEVDYKRYVGAQIGIYNQQGKKVGQVKKLHNKEFLYIVNSNR
jgi:adenine-specific DNA-methyltransferase